MARLRYNGLSTTLGASVTSSATAVTFAAALTHSGGTAVPTIGAGDYIPLSILDSTGKLSEIVYLTAYTSGATTGTITRAQEGTTGVSHASGDRVVAAPTVADFVTADTPPATPNAKDDEFSDLSGQSGPMNGLAAKWSKRNLATASWLALDKNSSALSITIPPSQAVDQSLYQTAPAGDFRVSAGFRVHTLGGIRLMFGVFIVDATGKGIAVNWDTGAPLNGGFAGSADFREITSWQQTAVNSTLVQNGAGFPFGGRVYASLRKSGTTYYGAAWSDSSLTASTVVETAYTPAAFTPAYVGIGQIHQQDGSNNKGYLIDWFRVS